jgi:hypothetical protein
MKAVAIWTIIAFVACVLSGCSGAGFLHKNASPYDTSHSELSQTDAPAVKRAPRIPQPQ